MSKQKVEVELSTADVWLIVLFFVAIVVWLSGISLKLDRIATALEAPKTAQPGIDSNDTDAFLKGLGLLEEPDE